MAGEVLASSEAAAAACPNSGELQLLITGRLPNSRHVELEQHILDCASCQVALASIDEQLPSEPSAMRGILDFPALLSPDNLLVSPASSTVGTSADSERTLGDYRVIRQIGRGGMGVVFEAEQISLRRRVALKTLPMAALLDPKRLQRFRNEAHAAALLHHPNIVPVYSFGIDHGVHFYAMQYIEGVNLARVLGAMQLDVAADQQEASPRQTNLLDTTSKVLTPLGSTGVDPNAETGSNHGWKTDFPEPQAEEQAIIAAMRSTSSFAGLITARRSHRRDFFRRVAELGKQAADALHFAHEQGVVHRDVKPSNLIIDPSARLWVTDFGLAHLDTEGTLTMSGDILGTLRYMSPEQSSGKPGRVDFRTDIYSLGATLYELLTLQPLFPDADRQAILAHIANNEPRTLRSVDPEIPADLETVVLKALSKEPLDRYATAGELADDLRRFLDDVPIRAKRPSRVERTIKWVRRHNRLVSVAAFLIATMICLIAAAAALLGAGWQRESQLRQLAEDAAREATAQSAEANAERAHAERNFRRALQAVDEMFTQVGLSDLAEVPQMEPVRRALTQKALAFYQGFLAERSNDPELAYETGRAWVRVGYVHRILGELAEAEQAARQGLAIFETLGAEQSGNSVHRLDLMMAYEEIAMDLMQVQRRVEALEIRRSALELMKTIVRDFPEPAHHWIRLADAHCAYANTFHLTGQPISIVEPYHRKALATLEYVQERYPEEDLLAQFAHKRHWLGACLMQQNKFEEAKEQLSLAIELREKQLRRNPISAGVKHDLAHAIGYYAKLPIPLGREGDAEDMMKRNLVLVKELVRDFPDTFDYVIRLAMAYRGYGQFLMNYERYSESRDLHLEYVEFLKQSRQKFTAKDKRTGDMGWAYYSLGANLLELGRVEDARTAFRSARENFEQYVIDVPHDLRAKWYLAVFMAECPDESVNESARAKEMLTQIVAVSPDTREYWAALAVAEHRLRNWQGFRDALSKAVALAAEPIPIVEQFGLAIANWHLGDNQAALESYRIAAAEMDRLSIRDYDLRKWREKARATLGLGE